MGAFYFFVFIGIVGFFVDSIKKVRHEQTTKNKVILVGSIVLLLFGFYLLAEALGL